MAVPPYVTAGTVIEETWGDQIADSVVNPFASSAARSAAITSPTNGMVSTITAASTLNGVEVYNGANWARPWNMPWGPVTATSGGTNGQGVARTVSNSAGATTTAGVDWAGLTVTFTANPNRIYRTTAFGMLGSDNAASSDYVELVITDAAGTALAASRAIVQLVVLEGRSVSYVEIGATGSITRKVRVARASGSGTCIGSASVNRQASIVVEDIGPAGAPV
jgi:hypothetical protein